MIGKTRLSLICAALVSLVVSGCVPSDAEIESEMAASRRQAYLEWKNSRERGQTKDVKVDGPLALEDAIKLALQYNKLLQSAIQDREVTRGERIAAYAVVLPSVTLTGSATRVEKGRGNSDIDRYAAGVTVTQPIFEGERIPATLRTARFYTALTDEQIREQVQTLIQDVANNYYDVLLAQHLVETHREALVSAEAQLRMVSEKKKQETATDYDVLRAQVDVATYRAKMISEQNAVDTNRVIMLKNMGVSQDSEITFSDKLEFLPMRPVFERAVELASNNRPDVRIAELDARIAQEAVRIARSAFWPSIAATFHQGWQDGWGSRYDTAGNAIGGRDAFGRNPWQAGVNAQYYFGIDNVGNLRSQKATAAKRQIEILDRQETALKEIRQQINNLANAEEMIKALVVNQDAAREALRLVEVGYQAGVRTEVDVTDARSALTEVIGQYYTSLTDHTKARLALQVAMGVLGPARITDDMPLPPSVPIANIEEFAATDYVPPQPITIPSSETRRMDRRLERDEQPRSRSVTPRSTTPRSTTPPPSSNGNGAPRNNNDGGNGTRQNNNNNTGSGSSTTRPLTQAKPVAPAPRPVASTPAPAPRQTAPAATGKYEALARPPQPSVTPVPVQEPVVSSAPVQRLVPVMPAEPVAQVQSGGVLLPPPPSDNASRSLRPSTADTSPVPVLASAPAAPAQIEQPKAKPMFRVTVREAASDMPEVAGR